MEEVSHINGILTFLLTSAFQTLIKIYVTDSLRSRLEMLQNVTTLSHSSFTYSAQSASI